MSKVKSIRKEYVVEVQNTAYSTHRNDADARLVCINPLFRSNTKRNVEKKRPYLGLVISLSGRKLSTGGQFGHQIELPCNIYFGRKWRGIFK